MVKYEYYYASGFHYPCTDMHLYGQSFTPLQAHTIKKVALKLYRVGNPGIVAVHIYNTLAHIPVGAPICSGTTNANTLTTDTDGEEREILLGAGADLDNEVLYAKVLVGTALGDTHWIGDPMGVSYDRGTGLSSPDGGITWFYEAPPGTPAPDMWFEEWGDSLLVAPTVTTNPATLISQVSATLNGTLTADGGEACECGFQWGLTDAYGHTTLTESKVTGESFSRAIHGLFPGFTYHFRAFATNSAGTGYGADRSFTSTPTFNRAHALSREEL